MQSHLISADESRQTKSKKLYVFNYFRPWQIFNLLLLQHFIGCMQRASFSFTDMWKLNTCKGNDRLDIPLSNLALVGRAFCLYRNKKIRKILDEFSQFTSRSQTKNHNGQWILPLRYFFIPLQERICWVVIKNSLDKLWSLLCYSNNDIFIQKELLLCKKIIKTREFSLKKSYIMKCPVLVATLGMKQIFPLKSCTRTCWEWKVLQDFLFRKIVRLHKLVTSTWSIKSSRHEKDFQYSSWAILSLDHYCL